MDNQGQDRVYVTMMVDSLKKKEKVLNRLLSITEKQRDLLKEEKMDADAFDGLLMEKERAIVELNELDGGFDGLFKLVKKQIESDREQYREEIQQMQQLIAVLSELDVSIRSLESQNNERFKKFLGREKDMIRNYHINNRTATTYYQNMANVHRKENSYFFNEKK